MYAIIGYLDHETETKISDLRNDLNEAGIAGLGMRPHITLATHANLHLETFKRELESYFINASVVPLFFPSLGMFLNSGTLYLSPTKNEILNSFHLGYHEKFNEQTDPASLYSPSQWVPHCTIAMHLTHQELVQAFDFSARKVQPFYATLTSIGLIQLQYEGDVCTSVKELLTVNLS